MIVQVELRRPSEHQVYWLNTDQKLIEGRGINIAESGWWTIGQVMVTLSDPAAIPPKARFGTIVELN